MESKDKNPGDNIPEVSPSGQQLQRKSLIERITYPLGAKDMGVLMGIAAGGYALAVLVNKLVGNHEWDIPSNPERGVEIGWSLITFFGLRKVIRGSFRERLFRN